MCYQAWVAPPTTMAAILLSRTKAFLIWAIRTVKEWVARITKRFLQTPYNMWLMSVGVCHWDTLDHTSVCRKVIHTIAILAITRVADL